MKAILILFASFLLLLVSSCKKATSATSTTSTSSLVRTYTENITSTSLGNSNTTYDAAYDDSNRALSITDAASSGNRFVYVYNTNHTFIQDIYGSNVWTLHEAFFINSNSLVDSTLQYDVSYDTSTEKYIYNSGNQLDVVRDYDYSVLSGTNLNNSTYYTYDVNGNPTTVTDTNSVITNTYSNLLTSTLNNGVSYYPANRNLVLVARDSIYGGTVSTATHTYTFDSNNRLSTDRIVVSNGDVVIKTYTY
jgi:hypothetical protein